MLYNVIVDNKLEVLGLGAVIVKLPKVDTINISFFDKTNVNKNSFGVETMHYPMVDSSMITFVLSKEEKNNYINLLQKDGIRKIIPLPKILKDRECEYWFSLNKESGVISCGIGRAIKALELFSIDLKTETESFGGILEKIDRIAVSDNIFDNASNFEILKYPVVEDTPPLVIKSEDLTPEILDDNQAIVPACLSEEAQLLYNTISGSNMALNTPDFPDFADAINYSISTKGKICYNKLLSKQGEFGSQDSKATYLRVTIGKNLSDSPGVPLVLEIWPSGHYSPIHSHSDCNAIIKVLHGSITVEWFSELSTKEVIPYKKIHLCNDQVTWLNSRYYQIHKIYNHNISGNMCATLQGYRYNDSDNRHYEYFDYIDNDGIKQFNPISDWGFTEFKELIREEWKSRFN